MSKTKETRNKLPSLQKPTNLRNENRLQIPKTQNPPNVSTRSSQVKGPIPKSRARKSKGTGTSHVGRS